MNKITKLKTGYLINQKEVAIINDRIFCKHHLEPEEENAVRQFKLSEDRGLKIKSSVS